MPPNRRTPTFQRTRSLVVLVAAVCLSATLAAQTPVAVTVDAAGSPHPIDPRIYGVNNAVSAADLDNLNCPLNRYGGNNTSRYNWTIDADNRARSFFFETFLLPPYTGNPGGYDDNFINSTQSVFAEPMITIPMGDWVGKLGAAGANTWSFSVITYGAQCQTADCCGGDADAGNGFLPGAPICGPQLAGNDPNDANTPSSLNTPGTIMQQDFINHLVAWHAATPLKYYMLDNEGSIWWYDHFDVMPTGVHDDNMIARMESYGDAIRAADPSAIITGPEEWGWDGYIWSGYDQQNIFGIGTPDHDAHGDYIPYMLQQINAHDAGGPRSLDVLTAHFYPQGDATGVFQEFSDDVSTTTQNLRNRSTRSLWDPLYLNESWINDFVYLVPRLKGYVSANYPGLQTGLTEYNWGADGTFDSTLGYMNGATAEADILGILGREGIDMATRWEVPPTGGTVYNAMKMYRNYDGSKSTFSDVSVTTSSDQNTDDFAVFGGSRTADGAMTVMLVAKNLANSYTATVQLSNFTSNGTAQVWQLASPGTAIVRLADIALVGSTATVTVPAQSITLLVIPAGGGCPTITLSPATLPDGTVGTAYAGGPVTASGGTGPYTFAVTLGTFPTGLNLAADGTITGTPTAAGTFSFTVTATDTVFCTGSLAYQIIVNPFLCPTITVDPPTLPSGTIGTAYAGGPVTASGGTGPYTFAVTSGTFPTGLTLAADGTITGTSTAIGTFNFTVTATDVNVCAGSMVYQVVISAVAVPLKYFTISPCRLIDTRRPASTYGGPALQGGGTQRAFPVGGQCGVPADASAISINMTVVLPTASGDLRAFPTGTPAPNSSVINFGAGQIRANNGILPIDGTPAGSLTVQCDMSGSTQFLLDISGYFKFVP
jgi:hypothetical protein